MGDQYAIARAALNLAGLAFEVGDYDEAVTRSHAAVEESRKLGNSDLLAGSLTSLGFSCLRTHRLDEAVAATIDGAAAARSVHDELSLREVLLLAGAVLARAGEHEAAGAIVGALERACDELVPLEAPLEAVADELRSEARAELGDLRYGELVSVGGAMGLDEAVSSAVEQVVQLVDVGV